MILWLLLLAGAISFLPACSIDVDLKTTTPSQGAKAPVIDSATVANNLLILQGSSLQDVKTIKIQGVADEFSIKSQTDSQIEAYVTSSLKLIAEKSYNLIIATAHAETIAPITLTLDSMGAQHGQVPRFNATTNSWVPDDLNGLQFIATWDATQTFPGANANSGDFYIVSVPGTTTVNGVSLWDIGDWVIFNGTEWEKVNNAGGVTSFNGRSGAVTPQPNDYSLYQLSNVNVTATPTNGAVLKYNSATSNWEAGTDMGAGSGTISADSATFNGSGTGLSVTNNAMIGGALTVDSIYQSGHTMTVGDTTGDTALRMGKSSNGAATMNVLQLGSTLSVGPINEGSVVKTDIYGGGSSPGISILNNGSVGIGTASPSGKLDVVHDGAFNPIFFTNYSGASAPGAYFLGRGARGTATSPMAILSGDELAVFGGRGYGATGFSSGTRGYMAIVASENWTDSAQGTQLIFRTTPTGTTASDESVRITSSGNVGIGTTTPTATLDVAGGYFRTLDQSSNNTPTSGQGTEIMSLAGTSYINSYNRVSSVYRPMIINASSLVFNTGSAGNVGIGTSSPSAKLDISAGNLDLDTTTNSNPYGMITKNGINFLHNFNYGNNGTVTTQGYNTFLGENAGNLTMGSTATVNTDSSYNTGVGYNSMLSNQRGRYNSAFGLSSLYANTDGYQNTAIGMHALRANTTGNNNAALGYNSGYYIADAATPNTTSGTSVYLGASTLALANGDQNEIVIGYYATGAGSNSVVLGNDNITKTLLKGNVGIGTTSPSYLLDVSGDINSSNALRVAGVQVCTSAGCTAPSDLRLKENIRPLEQPLENILNLNGVSYDWIDKEKYGSSPQVGLIAQDLETIYPEVVSTDSSTGFKSVSYAHLIAPIIEAVKALYYRIVGLEGHQSAQDRQIASKADKDEVDALKDENAKLKQENAEIRERLTRIEKMLLSK